MEWWSGSAYSRWSAWGPGFVSGLFGIGGGIVRIPLFVYLLPLFGVAQSVMMHVAVGTSMALVLPSAIAATRKQLALGNLDLAFFRTWAVGILIGVLVGTRCCPMPPPSCCR
jgi:uncharacterized membrane protein YfcA